MTAPTKAYLELEDGTKLEGTIFGAVKEADGEVVFNTGMVGYVESLTDPSYRGQILTLTYPLVGNYGVPGSLERYESDNIQVRGLVVENYIDDHSHWESEMSLHQWLEKEGIVALTGIDTRHLTKILREKGTMLGRIIPELKPDFMVDDPNLSDLVNEVTAPEKIEHPALGEPNGKHVLVVDCGTKRSIVTNLRKRGFKVTVVPYDHDFTTIDYDGIMLSNGPGDPAMNKVTIANVAKALQQDKPIAGICLGCQIMALAADGTTFKLPYGHRSQNQPCKVKDSHECKITSQNHGFAVDADSLPEGWEVWLTNLNDGTVEGIKHTSKPFFAVQFHPEATPGPTDSNDFFDQFTKEVIG